MRWQTFGLVLITATVAAAVGDKFDWLFRHPQVAIHGVKARVGTPADRASVDVYAQSSSARAGLFALSALAAGDTIVGIPSELLFHPTRLSDPLLHSFLNYTRESSFLLDQRIVLTIGLLQQYLRNVIKSTFFGDPAKLSGASAAAAAAYSTVWDDYLSSLPARPSSVLLFDALELEELQLPEGSPLFSAREQQLEYIAEMYKFVSTVIATNKPLHALFPKKDTFTEQWFTWAYVTVLNRGIQLPLIPWSANDSSIVVLAPFIDLLNHANPPHHNAVLELVRGTDTVQSHLRLVAARPIAQGEEITVSYSAFFPLADEPAKAASSAADSSSSSSSGSSTSDSAAAKSSAAAAADATRSVVPLPVEGYSNTQLMVHFGVALPVNEYEHIALDIGFDEAMQAEDELFEKKDRVITLNGLARECLVSVDGTLPPAFLHSLRVKQLTRDDLRRLAHFQYQFLPENGFLSLQNELRVQLQLLTSVEELLRGYATTLTDDTAYAANLQRYVRQIDRRAAAHDHPNMAQALNYRMSVKRVLHLLILRSLHSLEDLFTDLTVRWKTDLSAAINSLPKPSADSAAAKAMAAAASGAGGAGGDGKVEVNIDPQPSMEPMEGKWAEMEDQRSGAAGSSAETDRAWIDWAKWQRQLSKWEKSIARWHSEHTQWVRAALGTDTLPTPMPNKPAFPNDLLSATVNARPKKADITTDTLE